MYHRLFVGTKEVPLSVVKWPPSNLNLPHLLGCLEVSSNLADGQHWRDYKTTRNFVYKKLLVFIAVRHFLGFSPSSFLIFSPSFLIQIHASRPQICIRNEHKILHSDIS